MNTMKFKLQINDRFVVVEKNHEVAVAVDGAVAVQQNSAVRSSKLKCGIYGNVRLQSTGNCLHASP
jgi:hypothetical protein